VPKPASISTSTGRSSTRATHQALAWYGAFRKHDVSEPASSRTREEDVKETKPAPDLVPGCAPKAGTDEAVMWDPSRDVEAARKAGLKTLEVRTGGA
jgi:phosphoglycolate phosphatase-like HAD superfamily hydrolase